MNNEVILHDTPSLLRDDKGRWKPGIVPEGAKPWVKGQSGNPQGRTAKQKVITTVLEELLTQRGDNGKSNAENIAEAMLVLATDPHARGHVPTVKEILDRTEGKVTETIEVDQRSITLTYELVQSPQE